MDSCYGGAWVKKAYQLRTANLIMQTSCTEGERATDGRFTPLWLEIQGGDVPARVACHNLAPYALAQLRCLQTRNQHPKVYVQSTSGDGVYG